MSQAQKKKQVDSAVKLAPSEPSASSPELQQKLMHLQTILLLTQLNSAYYDLNLSLRKTLSRIEARYRKNKLHAFLQLYHYNLSPNLVKRMQADFQSIDQKRQKRILEDELSLSLEDEEVSPSSKKRVAGTKQSAEETRVKLAVQCRGRLTKLVRLVNAKRKNHLSYGWHRILNAESISVKILSEKSSRRETNDSHRSKVFQRSVERKPTRKSYSLEKPGVPTKHQYFVAVKFQSSKQQTPNNRSEERTSEPSHGSALNRFFQDRGEVDVPQRKSTLTVTSSDKNLKNFFPKKMSMSMLSGEKEDKIRELQYLKAKYKKIMDEFSWFSERFKRVIEEEDEVE